jgi:glyoxylase-like metal-dependent hydrolase (beta-lactamase superfamily II)
VSDVRPADGHRAAGNPADGHRAAGNKAADGMGTARAWCVLAPNPSPMTLDGTNTWVIAEPDSSSVLVVDPGPDDEAHLRRVLSVAAGSDRRVAQIVLTHGHPDHAAGAARFAELTGAPVAALDPARRLGSEGFGAGAVLTAGGCELRVVATPGHTADSLSLVLVADGALLTGDTVLGRGTTVIAEDGSLGDYLRSLDELRSLAGDGGLRVLLPGHGPLLTDPVGVLDYYIAHRRERLDQVRAAMAAGAQTPPEIVAVVYADVDRALWPAAEQSVRAQLDYLNGRLRRGLPRALAKALGVEDENRARRDLEPAPGGEVSEGLVDCLPGRPDELRELLLGEVVVDVQAVGLLVAEPVGKVEQVLRDPAGDVSEHEVGGHVVGPAQSLCERAEHVQRDLRPLAQPRHECLVLEQREHRVGHRARRRGPRSRVKQGQLAEHLARADHAQQVLAAVRGRAGELHLAVEDHVQRVAVIALQEQVLAAGKLDLSHLAAERAGTFIVKSVEQWRPSQHCLGVVHRSSLLPTLSSLSLNHPVPCSAPSIQSIPVLGDKEARRRDVACRLPTVP